MSADIQSTEHAAIVYGVPDVSPPADMKVEVVVLPVSDVGRAAEFYLKLGWRVDIDMRNGSHRILQLTPHGSGCSVMFGTGLTPSAPGSTQYLHLIVADVEATCRDLAAKGVETSGIFHDARGGYNRFDPTARESGLDPNRRSYASFLTFKDPDGNGWIVQEVTSRLPGRIEGGATSFASPSDIEAALRRTAAAHQAHESLIGAQDSDWPAWYAAYLAAEQSGQPLPQ